MSRSSRLFFAIAVFSSLSLRAESNKDFEQIPQNMKKAASAVIDWSFETTAQHPEIVGLCVASVLRMGKQAATQKPASFLIWAVAGVTLGAEASKIFANSYLHIKHDKKIESPFAAKVAEAKEAAQTLVAQAQDKVNEIIEEIKK